MFEMYWEKKEEKFHWYFSIIQNKPENTCDICEQFVPGNAERGVNHNVCNIFVKGNNSSLKVHTEIKHKDKAKSGI